MACTERDWLRWLPAAIGAHAYEMQAQRVRVGLDPGFLELTWSQEPPWRIAAVQMPRLHVEFEFLDVTPAQQLSFMQRFDLYLQRGGG